MKLMLLWLCAFAFSAPIDWEPDFDKALRDAKEQHQLVLLNFSGSDWCGPCIMLRKEYLESDAFTGAAKGKFILVNADFPRKKQNMPSADVQKRNDALAERYNKTGHFPFTVILDANGKVLKTYDGKPSQSVAEWVAELDQLYEKSH